MTTAPDKGPGFGLNRSLGLAATLMAIALLLAAPAAIYASMKPNLANLLALAVSIGVFVSAALLIRSRLVLIVVGLVILILNGVEIVHLVAFGSLVSLGGVEAILSVDPIEAREFIGDHAPAIAGGLLILPAFVALVLLKARFDRISRRARWLGAAAATLAPALLLSSELVLLGSPDDIYLPTRIFEHYVAYFHGNPLTQTISGFATTLAARHELAKSRAARAAVRFEATRTSTPAQETWVVVVGESSRRRNWGLYGYGRDTNPRLRSQPGLYVFENAISPGTVTGRSVPHSFYFPTSARDGSMQFANSFVSAFGAAGFKTFWLSNQGAHRSAVGSEIGLLMGEADKVETTNYGFWNSVLDEALFDCFDRALSDPAAHKLIVVHTLGSHTNYRQRYPAEWASRPLEPPARAVHDFDAISDADAVVIDDYDRTILYTDWILSRLMAKLGATGRYGGLVYFSDHGQRLFDDAAHAKGHGFNDLQNLDVEIPLLVWLSDELQKVSPEKRDRVAGNVRKPVMTVDIAASMLDLAGIALKPIEPTPSIFDPDYEVGPRRVLMPDGRLLPYDGSGQLKAAP